MALKILASANQRVVRAKIEYLALTKNYHDSLAKVRPPAALHNYDCSNYHGGEAC